MHHLVFNQQTSMWDTVVFWDLERETGGTRPGSFSPQELCWQTGTLKLVAGRQRELGVREQLELDLRCFLQRVACCYWERTLSYYSTLLLGREGSDKWKNTIQCILFQTENYTMGGCEMGKPRAFMKQNNKQHSWNSWFNLQGRLDANGR